MNRMNLRRLVGALAVLLCATHTVATAQDRHQVAESPNGMVVTAHPLATYAGQQMLEQGGNAADAATAAAFAVAVVRPSMNSIGGRNQILVRLASGEIHGIDGTTQVPLTYDPATAPRASYGYATIGTPGALAGLMRLHGEHGSLPLETVMSPALDYAENGFRLLPGQARFHSSSAERIAESNGARDVYLKDDGTPYGAGDLLRHQDMAGTLRKILEGGADAFYHGEIAEAMARDIEANGGFVTKDALAAYEAVDARIVRGSYRGYELVAMDVPASGAIAIQSLQIMENFERSEYTAAEWATLTAQALALAIPDLARLGSDSAAHRATSKDWAAQQAARVQLPVTTGAPSGSMMLEDHESFTTHLSVADDEGMIVSLTQTIGPAMGSKVVTPGLGFLYAVTLGGYLSAGQSPGARARSGITPLLVLRDGEPVLVLGAAGGLHIISSVVQATMRFVDDDMTLAEALAAPRVHPVIAGEDFTFSGVQMQTVPGIGWTKGQTDAVRAMGWEVREATRPGSFGRVQGIWWDATRNVWIGVSDPGSEGTALGSPLTP